MDVFADLSRLGSLVRQLQGQSKSAFQFAASWSNLGSGFEAATYSRYGRVVILQGDVTKSSAPAAGDLIGTLPAGYRPTGSLDFTCLSGNTGGAVSAGWLRVASDGTVKWQAGTTVGTPVVSLSGISFVVD